MIGEKTMKDLKKRILAQTYASFEDLVEQDLELFFDEVRKLKKQLTQTSDKKSGVKKE